jgi:hypothetical protein
MENSVSSADDWSRARAGLLPRTGALAAVVLATGLMVGACSDSSSGKKEGASGVSSSTGADGKQNKGVAYVECLRKNGLPNFPEPGANGAIMIDPNSGLDPNSPKFKKAEQACRSLAPKGRKLVPPPGGGPDPSKYVECMREKGVPKFPDADAHGMLDPESKGINTNTPAFKAAHKACLKFLPAGGPRPA